MSTGSRRLRPEIAARRIASFRARFGEEHIILARHAAFPLTLTPDLLYHLWASFQTDVEGRLLRIPWVAVADLLLSSLCSEVGHAAEEMHLFEMDLGVRAALLDALKADSRFGPRRLSELSAFLLEYVRHQSYAHAPEPSDLAASQRWIALAYVQPSAAARELAEGFAKAGVKDRPELLRIASITEALEPALSTFTPLLEYAKGMAAFAQGDMAIAAKHLEPITTGTDIRIAGIKVPLPTRLRKGTQQVPTAPRPSHARPVLTIELRQEGRLLVRSYQAPSFGRIEGLVPVPQVLAEVGVSYATPDGVGFVALAAVLSRGEPGELDRHLGGAQLDRAGEVLFEVLFGIDEHRWRTVIQTASGVPQEVSDPVRVPLRIRILTDVVALLGLPWRVTRWKGYLLRDYDWTFEVTSQLEPHGPRARIDYRSPGRVLVIAPHEPSPGAAAGPFIEVDRHVEDLAALFDGISPGFNASGRLQVARSHDDLPAALMHRPDFVYFYGHGEMRDGKPHLRLGDGPADWMHMREFANLFRDTPPLAVFLNGFWTTQGSWQIAGYELLSFVPLVIVNSMVASAESARRFALDWIESWLGRGKDPVEAAHARPIDTKHLSGWTPAVVYANYEIWETSRPPMTRIRLDRAEDWLDRAVQRAIAYKRIMDFVRDERQQVEAIISFGMPGNGIDRVVRQITDFIEREAGDRIHIRRVSVPFPEGRDLAPKRFEHGLAARLEVPPGGALAPALARNAPALKGGAKRLLWLDWGVVRGRDSYENEVFDWLEFARDYLATLKLNGFQVVVSLSLEAEGDAFKALEDGLPDLRGREDMWTDRFRCTALDPLGPVNKADILTFLEHNGCDRADVRILADDIFRAAQGQYENTQALLRDGIRLGWRVLLGRIRTPGPRRHRFDANSASQSDVVDFGIYQRGMKVGEVLVEADPEQPDNPTRTIEHWCFYPEYAPPSHNIPSVTFEFVYGGIYGDAKMFLRHVGSLLGIRYVRVTYDEQSSPESLGAQRGFLLMPLPVGHGQMDQGSFEVYRGKMKVGEVLVAPGSADLPDPSYTIGHWYLYGDHAPPSRDNRSVTMEFRYVVGVDGTLEMFRERAVSLGGGRYVRVQNRESLPR